MTKRRINNWTEDECLRILTKHWDNQTAILNVQALAKETGGIDAAASLFAATLSFGLRIWERHVGDALRNIILGHLLPQKKWLKSLWDYSEAMIDSDPDEFVHLFTLISAAQSDFVRAWMTKPLVTLLQSASESRRMLGFQGLECLITSGAANSVKRFEPVLRDIITFTLDIRDREAALELMRMVHPIPATRVRIYPKEAIAMAQMDRVFPETTSILLPVKGQVGPEQMRKSLKQALDRILSRFDADEGMIDMLAAEIEWPPFSIEDSNKKLRPIRAMSGRFAHLCTSDKYDRSEAYPFIMQWTHAAPLWIQIFPLGVTVDYFERNKEPGAFAVTLDAVLDVKSNYSEIDKQADELLIRCPSTFGNADTRRAAAKVAIQSTRYTQDLMDREFAQQHQGELQNVSKAYPLPHLDQRNLLFLTQWIQDTCVGGTAIYSHFRLDANAVVFLQFVNRCIMQEFGFITSQEAHRPEQKKGGVFSHEAKRITGRNRKKQ